MELRSKLGTPAPWCLINAAGPELPPVAPQLWALALIVAAAGDRTCRKGIGIPGGRTAGAGPGGLSLAMRL